MIKTATVERPQARLLFSIHRSLEVDEYGGRKESGQDDKTNTRIDAYVLFHDAGFISILPVCQWIDAIRERCS